MLAQPEPPVNARDKLGATPLHYACVLNPTLHPLLSYEATCAKLLVAAGADVNMQEAMGDTALIGAAKDGLHGIVKELLRHPRVDVNIRGFGKEIAADQAQKSGHPKVADMLRKFAAGEFDPNVRCAATLPWPPYAWISSYETLLRMWCAG